MAGPSPLLVAALCISLTGAANYGHTVQLNDDGRPWINLWTKLLHARYQFDREEELLAQKHSLRRQDNSSSGLPESMELEADDGNTVISGMSGGVQSSAGPSRRDQAIAKAIGPYISPIANPTASKACLDSSIAYVNNIFNKQWALKMFDATGKLPDGIFTSNINPFGNWDECLNTTAHFNDTDILGADPSVTSFTGKYCITYLFQTGGKHGLTTKKPPVKAPTVGIAPFIPILPLNGQAVTAGVCIPSTCTSQELMIGLNAAFKGKIGAFAQETTCYTKNDKSELTSGAIVMIVILSLAAFFMLVGTTVDLVAVQAAESPDSRWTRIHSVVRRTLPNTLRKVFLAFSVYTNGRKLLDTSSSADTLTCLHGIRFLSMTWVILGHTYFFALFFKQQNLVTFYSVTNDPAFIAVTNATVSVDSFFFLSGLLVSYIVMRNLDKTGGKFNIIMFYVHRYIRLTPVLMIIIGFVATLYVYLGSGPWWGFADQGTPQICRDHWWQNMLYVNNLVDTNNMCLGQTWYLANDMQMFIFSPLILLPLYHWPTFGQLWIIFLICFFTGINAMISAIHKLGPNGSLPGGDDDNLRYMKPWTRAGPYLVGLYTGWVLHKIRGRKIHLPAPVVAIGWLTASLTGCLIVYGLYGLDNPNKTAGIIYGMLNRTAWSICLAWVVFACVTGHAGVVNTILSWKAFIPLSRLTYTSYLTSIDIQTYYWYTNRSPAYLDQTFMVYLFLASLPVIFAVSAIFSLAFESPMMALEKIIFPQPLRGTTGGPPRPATQHETPKPLMPDDGGNVNAGFQNDGGQVPAEQTVPETSSAK